MRSVNLEPLCRWIAFAFERAARQRTIFDFKIAQIWKRGRETERVAIARVDARHERFDQIFIRFTPKPTADKCAERFIAVEGFCGLDKIKSHARFAKP